MPTKLHFKVIHASGQDDCYRAAELNNHSPHTKGWQSSRFCLYPQDIVIQLESRSRLRKIQILSHQFLIATKIEFFVGDVPDGVPLSLDTARYTRLGYVSLSDNEKTGYKARELKSVHVDAVGVFLKLNIHKNHVNKFNLYNQVGIIAINVIGDKVNKYYDSNYMDISDSRAIDRDPALEGFFNRPDYISPLDDLAFDMYQDPEIAQIIRRLEQKKQEAVLHEKYDYAKRLKHAITELQKVGEKLGKMEVEKRQAVENEDYDKAKVKKLQMDEYRLQIYGDLNIPYLMESNDRPRQAQSIDYEQMRQPTPPRMRELPRSPRTPTPPRYDERPLPISHRPALVVEDEPEPDPETAAGEPEPMTEKDIRDASSAIDVFGHPLVSKAYSKTWSYREDSLLAVYKQMETQPSTLPKEDAKSTMRAAIFLVKRAIDDKVYAVFKAALQLERMILTEYVPRHKIPRQETVSAVERTIPNLLHKSGDTAIRNRDDTKKFIQEMSNFPEVRPTNVVPTECLRPVKPSMAPRLAESRVEIVESLYKDLGLGNSGLNVDNLMPFCVEALQHNAGEVREVSERIIKSLYKDVGAKVKDFLPPDDEKTRKNTLWRQLFEYFDKVDGKPSKSDLKKQKADEESKKQAEIDALQKQLQQLKDMAAGKAPIDQNMVKGGRKTGAQPAKSKAKQKSKPLPPKPPEDDNLSEANMDKICIFCGEKNESFNDEGLDLHYWKNCPMLKRCTHCKQVVEIASLTDHLLGECESKQSFNKCPRCSEAIFETDYDQHIAEKTCNPSKSNMSHCPLCHQNLENGEDGWKKHLMGEKGCKQNTRRLLALDKQGPSQSRLPAAKSRVPTKTKTGRR